MRGTLGQRPPLAALVGPTASGKSRMALEVALELRSTGVEPEIVSCDSMGVYRGLDIAADKPSTSDRRLVPHHMFDVVHASADYTAVAYRQAARDAIAGIHARGGLPMLVGGSGLWFRAVVDHLEFAPTDPALRSSLERQDPHELHNRLSLADPESAARIDPRNRRRVVRAVEILELTGRPPSELRGAWERREGPYSVMVAGLTWSREELLERAGRRIGEELEAGLLEEVRAALDAGISRTARQALGVKEMLEHLESGLPLEQARDLLVRNTRSFIRRQLSWFRADPRIEWVDASEVGWESARRRIVELIARAAPGEGSDPAAHPAAR
ncbi:MAG TPA: tRNA (adenosine(37)-N6)-dimethylallyltransferase MiaA [Actinomycetota bacterium]|nr:tRNA (adenosine(37)-N6)-dimethylallyltransferase MiaA [Actinomycetota bacterium]